LRIHHGREKSVSVTPGAPGGCGRVSSHMNRYVPPDRLRIGMERTELEMLALKRCSSIFPQHAQRLDTLLRHCASVMEVCSERLELLLHPSAADPENDSPPREHIHGRDFLCGVNRMPLRQDQYSGRELDGFGHRRHIRERD